ncbi:MAG: sodium:solute symporter family protein [Candidatus Methanomethylophilaceae archaeon]|nr:sodium:solute symporter family protein [Candidatus Methanomethylophilaceae archaeon]MDD3351564.1 sodium:solute symporter family protein [Candidatus Methanomethylophilaceae archaeon]MDD3986848.1 sodium:solute symporter family protein [Candidatus Methanomethylophilaceae archaeon]MDD4709332.1 sodium:solute symporter family protein [Candidatus Methanomethylophilaceae archaeon]MDY0252476.1 sodium:solute symporter family protein [Candidatus Methanomethylophilaceae archaeon]
MTEGVNLLIFGVMAVLFAVATAALGYFGYKNTRSSQQFMLGRNKTSPVIIALSYGATFLSASAIIGFGGQAAVHGMSILWLCFLNLFVGLVVAFIVFGPRTRRLGKKLGASTFADLLGKIYKSKGIRAFTAILIIIMMPIYCAAVLKGAVNSLSVVTGLTQYYDVLLVALALVVALYVVYGGIIAVMYNDALQAAIMFIGMAVILVFTYTMFGGVSSANGQLTDLWDAGVIDQLGTLEGARGWTSFSEFGSSEWMLVVTTFLMGVGIGSLTQPQLVVRFMSAKDDKTLYKSLMIGSIFMLVVVGSAYTVGPLSNIYFANEYGMGSFEYIKSLGLGTDFIIPQFLSEIFSNTTFGDVFISLFLLALISAAISTLSALMHTIGVAGGYDLFTLARGRFSKDERDSQSIRVNRIFTMVMLVVVVAYCYVMPKDIIAKATSVFMGLTAAALLPAFAHALYSKAPNTRAAIASMASGTVTYMIWALFINSGTATFLPICRLITGNAVLFPGSAIAGVDAMIVALPISIIAMLFVLLVDKISVNSDAEASNL